MSASLKAVSDYVSSDSGDVSLSVAQAAASGDQHKLLIAMRDVVALAITRDCPARELASLTKRLQDITRDLSILDAQLDDSSSGADGGSEVGDDFDAEAI